MTEPYMTQREAKDFLGMHFETFRRYAERFGIKGERQGRCLYYKRTDIEHLDKALQSRVPTLIRLLEELTGCQVNLIKKTNKG